MRLQTYRDETRSRHFDLIGSHPWAIDVITVLASGILVLGFAGAVAAILSH